MNNSSGGASGAGIYLNNGAICNMYGGSILGNQALGAYSSSPTNGDHGGGGVSIVRTSSFIMHGGLIEGNSATVGGGVFVTAKANANPGASFVFNGGTVQNNIATEIGSNNVHYGNDIAVAARATVSSTLTLGRSVQVGPQAVIGEGFVAVASHAAGAITGYDLAVYPRDITAINHIGAISDAAQGAIAADAAANYSDYTPYTSFWLADNTVSGDVQSGVSYPVPLQADPNGYLYLVAVQALDSNGTALAGSPVSYVVPSRSGTGLEITNPVVTGAEAYGYLILAKVKALPLDLTATHVGQGSFEETSTGHTSIPLSPGETTSITATPSSGWLLQSVTFTAGDGTTYTKVPTSGEVTVAYSELASGTNTIHAVFVLKNPRQLVLTHEGQGIFTEQGTGQTSISIAANTSASLRVEAANGWSVSSITLTDGNGVTSSRTSSSGIVTIGFDDLTDGNNSIHVVFTEDAPGPAPTPAPTPTPPAQDSKPKFLAGTGDAPFGFVVFSALLLSGIGALVLSRRAGNKQ